MAIPQSQNHSTPEFGRGVDKRIALGFVFLAACAAYSQDLLIVMNSWLDLRGYFSHGFLVLVVVAMLLWERRATILNSAESVSWLYTGFAAAASLLWLVAWAADIQAIRLAASVAVIMFACCAVLGRRSLFTFALPFALLFLAVPIWRPVVPVLQSVAASIVEKMISSVGIPSFINGNFIQIPGGVFEVAGGCSGLGFVLVSLFFAAYLLLQSNYRTSVIVGALCGGLLFGLLTNWVRIFLIIAIAHVQGIDHPIVREHIWFGWVVYGVLCIPMAWVVMRFFPPTAPARQAEIAGHRVSMPAAVMVVVASAVVALFSLWLDSSAQHNPQREIVVPDQVADFRSVPAHNELGWQPDYPYADDITRASYVDSSGILLQTFAAAYHRQVGGRELISMHNEMADRRIWTPLGIDLQSLQTGGQTYTLSELALRNEDDERLCVWYWYRVGNQYAGTEFDAKLKQIMEKIRGRTDGAITATAIHLKDQQCSSVRDVHARFHAALLADTQI